MTWVRRTVYGTLFTIVAATVVSGMQGSDPGPSDPGAPAGADVIAMTPEAVPATPAGKGMASQRAQSGAVLVDEQMTILAILLGLLASMVLCLGFWFTAHELKRLSSSRAIAPRSVSEFRTPTAELTRSAARARSAALLL